MQQEINNNVIKWLTIALVALFCLVYALIYYAPEVIGWMARLIR